MECSFDLNEFDIDSQDTHGRDDVGICYVLMLTIVMLITNRDDTKPSLKSRRGKVAGFIEEPAGLP